MLQCGPDQEARAHQKVWCSHDVRVYNTSTQYTTYTQHIICSCYSNACVHGYDMSAHTRCIISGRRSTRPSRISAASGSGDADLAKQFRWLAPAGHGPPPGPDPENLYAKRQYGQSPYQASPNQHLMTQHFWEITYGPGNSTPYNSDSA